MKTEENKRLLALASIIADVKVENMELEQRVHQLMDDCNEAVRQLNGIEKRKNEDQPKQPLEEMRKMRDHCDKLEWENEQLKRYVRAIDSFIKERNLYMPEGASCPYLPCESVVASQSCVGCDFCLRLLDNDGVVCRKILEEAIKK